MLADRGPKHSSRLHQTWLRGGLFLIALFLALGPRGVRAANPDPKNKVDFNFQVRPILADRCFKCHGPDEKARKAKLRLDLPESAYSIRDTNKQTRAIVPSHPERSELVRRITTSDDDDRMPPPASNLTLTPEEKDVLRRWVTEGAEYKTHWAFSPVHKPVIPSLEQNPQVRNPVDSFGTGTP